MASIELFNNGTHKNIWIEDFGEGEAVQANQHLIIHGKEAIILDPGGHKIYNRVLSETMSLTKASKLKYIFLSHQDPDVVAATNGWLMTTDAEAYASALWVRFIPHFGLDHLVEKKMKPIPDEGMILKLGGAELLFLPAHFLHSCGNFQLYDTVSKILYTGDLGASLGMNYQFATNFEEHLAYMTGFHQRYMASNKVMRAWAKMAKQLEIEQIVPQHGAAFKGKEMVAKFIDWCENLDCGIDLLENKYQLPVK